MYAQEYTRPQARRTSPTTLVRPYNKVRQMRASLPPEPPLHARESDGPSAGRQSDIPPAFQSLARTGIVAPDESNLVLHPICAWERCRADLRSAGRSQRCCFWRDPSLASPFPPGRDSTEDRQSSRAEMPCRSRPQRMRIRRARELSPSRCCPGLRESQTCGLAIGTPCRR